MRRKPSRILSVRKKTFNRKVHCSFYTYKFNRHEDSSNYQHKKSLRVFLCGIRLVLLNSAGGKVSQTHATGFILWVESEFGFPRARTTV